MNVINLSCCGNMGRFGNQLFQLAFGLGYAQTYGAELRIPAECPLRQIFQLDHIKPIDKILPQTGIDQIPFGQVGIDLVGYFQHTLFLSLYSRQDCLEWFKFRPEIIKQYLDALTPASGTDDGGPHYVAHLRRGDYPQYPWVFTTVSEESYLRSFEREGIDKNDVHWCCETPLENPLDFLYDFFVMKIANQLWRANSSFSWWAHVLASPSQKIYAPVVKGVFGQNTSCDFVAGNWPQFMSSSSPSHGDLFLREHNY